MALPTEKLGLETIVDITSDAATGNNEQESSDNTANFLPPIKQVSEYVQLAKSGGHKGEYCEKQLVRNNK